MENTTAKAEQQEDRIAPNTIRNIAHEVRIGYDHLAGRCHYIAEGIQERTNRAFDITAQFGVREVQVGDPRATHFVNTLPMENYTEGGDDGTLLIDASIQQFCLSNEANGVVEVALGPFDELPATGLYEPGCEERIVWYAKPNEPELTGRLEL
jgi:hypothetical protein